MIARIMVSLYAVPALGYLAVCFGDPTAWIFCSYFSDSRIYICVWKNKTDVYFRNGKILIWCVRC